MPLRHSYLSLFVLVAACAATQPPAPVVEAPARPTPQTVPPAPAPVAQAPATASLPAATPPAPVVQTPQSVFATFDDWKSSFIDKARARGFDPTFVAQVLDGVTPLASVTTSDSQQPEFSKPISSYIRGAVTQGRIDTGVARLGANLTVPNTVSRFGVPAAILGGIWGMESDFGRVQGDIDVISAYATLAYNGRRRVWAEEQLLYTLTILKEHRIDRSVLRGSWAGAMGQTQFLPENYLKLGADGDGDGVVDIWKSDSDALASAANLLSNAGWKPGQAWAVEVILPAGFDYYLSETEQKTPGEWSEVGVRRADGGYYNPAELNEKATLILPSGANGPAFLAFPNHYVIRKYNNSTAYALAVGLIADGIEGRSALKWPWPVEQPLHIDMRKGAQQALKDAGFDPGIIDGVIGVGTRKALREWQRANGVPADGYLSYELAARLSGLRK